MSKKRGKNILTLNLMFVFLVYRAIASSICFSQSQNRLTDLDRHPDETLKVFIDCADCDFSYIRNQIKFVNFVRDPHVAHIHVLIVKQKTASGGYKYTIRFIGQFRFENIEQSLYYISAQTDSKDDIRQGLIREFGLLPFVSQTPISHKIDVKYDEQKVDSLRKLDTDKWMYWVFNIEATGEIDASLENNHYYQDFSKNRLKLETALSFWIVEGLAFKLGLEAESIHDQLYLPKGEATREEILLKQKQLETNYDLSIRAGLRYSFGSIYNNVVNRRF